MPQSLSRIWLHLVFSTKDRHTFLKDENLRDEMFRMLGHHANELECPSVCVGGWEDHVHILCGLSRTITVSKLVEKLKNETSKWAKKRSPSWRTFYWQSGYGVFSVSQSMLARVEKYIKNQPQHHRRISFQDEYRSLCAKHEVLIDERYVWD